MCSETLVVFTVSADDTFVYFSVVLNPANYAVGATIVCLRIQHIFTLRQPSGSQQPDEFHKDTFNVGRLRSGCFKELASKLFGFITTLIYSNLSLEYFVGLVAGKNKYRFLRAFHTKHSLPKHLKALE